MREASQEITRDVDPEWVLCIKIHVVSESRVVTSIKAGNTSNYFWVFLKEDIIISNREYNLTLNYSIVG